MIKLIKNEFFKLFHKLSTYIILLIAVVFVLITNIIYKQYDQLNLNVYYEEIDITEVNNFINNYDPTVDSLDDYVYNLALLDCYNLSHRYDANSWQYQVFMNDYLELDTEYYRELYSSDGNSTKAEELNKELFNMLQAVYTNNWQYFAEKEKSTLENTITEYQEILEEPNLSAAETKEYNKQLFIASAELELVNYRLDNDLIYQDDYLNLAINDIKSNLYALADYYYEENIDASEYEDVIKYYHENKYILEEKIDTKNSNTLRSVIMNFFTEYSFLILVFTIMIAGSIVSDEFSRGTIKKLLTVPHKRSTILWSKYITVLLTIPIIVLFLLICELIIGGLILGFDSLSIPAVIYNISLNKMEVLNVFSYFLLTFLANLPQLILLVTLAFACSTILNSTAFAITITFCGIIAAEIINGFALVYNIKLLDYFVTTNWDFTQFLFGGDSIFGLSIGFSALICLTYLVIMLIITFITFIYKDIKNV